MIKKDFYKKGVDISIIMPVFNEEASISKTVKELIGKLQKTAVSFELILVENGSADKSGFLIDRLSQNDDRIRAIHLPLADYGKALRKGYLTAKGEVVVNFSVDWVDLSFLKRAIKLLKDNSYDIVIASKNIARGFDERSFIRRYGGFFYHFLVKLLFSLSILDTHGLKVFRRKAVLDIIKNCRFNGEIFDTEFIIRSSRKNKRIKELPVYVKDRRPSRVRILNRAFKCLIQLLHLRLLLWFNFISL